MHGNTYHTRQISSDEEAILEVLAGFVKGWNLHNVSLFALPAAKENEIGGETDKQYALTDKPSINSWCQWSRENEGTFTNACQNNHTWKYKAGNSRISEHSFVFNQSVFQLFPAYIPSHEHSLFSTQDHCLIFFEVSTQTCPGCG